MKKVVSYLVLLSLLLSAAYVRAGEIVVDRNFTKLTPGKQLEILEDLSKSLTYDKVISMPFLVHNKSSVNVGFTNAYYWIRLRIRNTDSVAVPLMFEVSNSHINKLRFYYTDQKGVLQTMETGDHFPFEKRPFNHPHFVFPITLEPHQSVEYYLWVDKHGEQLQIPVELFSVKEFDNYSDKLFLFFGLMLGITTFYWFVSLVMLIFFRQYTIFYFWVYSVAVWVYLVAHSGLGFQFIWSNSIWWASSARPISSLSFYLFSVLFTRQFFKDYIKNRYFDLYTRILVGALFVLIMGFVVHNPALGLFKEPWYNPVYYDGKDLMVWMKIIYLVVLTVLWSIIGIGIYNYVKTKRKESLWFVLGFFLLMSSGTVTIFIFLGVIPDNYIVQNFPLVANPLELVILSFLIANRYKNIFLQNARISAELAEQRQQNAIRLLEGQIVERRRLSQELHDGISLALANIRLRLSLILEKHPSKEMNHLVEKLGEVGQDVRQFSMALSPVLLQKHSLTEAISELVYQTNASNKDVTIEFNADLPGEENFSALLIQTLYQVTLELLNNVVRHAKARQAGIDLREEEGFAVLHVSDDGIGYEEDIKEGGIGLQNIQARVQSLDGSFEVKRSEKGMMHTIRIPF